MSKTATSQSNGTLAGAAESEPSTPPATESSICTGPNACGYLPRRPSGGSRSASANATTP